jgi:hypothetical protein
MHAATPRQNVLNIELAYSIGTGQHWTQALVQVLPWQHDIFKKIYIFFTKRKNNWKISTFNYTTINFQNIYCRYIYVILHFVSFDLM